MSGPRLAARLREPGPQTPGAPQQYGGRRPPERINRVVAKHGIMGSEPAMRMTDEAEFADAVGRRHEHLARTFERCRAPMLR